MCSRKRINKCIEKFYISTLCLKRANSGQTFLKNPNDFLRGRKRELMPNAVLHQAKGAIAERQSFAEPFVRRHSPRSINLLARTFVHAAIIASLLRARGRRLNRGNTRSSFKTVSEKGTVPFCSEDCAKSGQSPTVLKLLLDVLRLGDGFRGFGVTFLALFFRHANDCGQGVAFFE